MSELLLWVRIANLDSAFIDAEVLDAKIVGGIKLLSYSYS